MSVYLQKLYPKTASAYLLCVVVLSVVNTHPAAVVCSFFCALCLSFLTTGREKTKKTLRFVLPVMLLMAVITPLTDHVGVTILTYLFGNPITREAVVYGVFASVNVAAVILWCAVYGEVVTTDKLTAMTGGVLPTLSLMLCMVTAMIPRFTETYRKTHEYRKIIDGEAVSKRDKLKNAVTVLSAVVTWALENGVQTAQSMRARGYGTGKRTTYLRSGETNEDKLFKWLFLALFCAVILGIVTKNLKFNYYIPQAAGNKLTMGKAALLLACALLYALPCIFEGKERAKWKS